jgi:hypothetical protein
MKNTLVCLLLITSLCSFTKKKNKSDAAFKKGNIIAMAGTGWPHMYGYSGDKLLGPIFAAGEWQASRRWSFGLNFCYHHNNTGVETHTVYTSNGTTVTPVYSFQYEQKITHHVFMATANYCYVNRGRVCLGSGIGFGYEPPPTVKTHFHDNVYHQVPVHDAGYFTLAFRVRLLDAKVRITEHFGLCGGVGYGVDGLISVGALYTFKGRDRR